MNLDGLCLINNGFYLGNKKSQIAVSSFKIDKQNCCQFIFFIKLKTFFLLNIMRFNNSEHIINVTWSEKGLSKYRRTTEKKPLKVLSIQMYKLGLVVNAFMWVATHLVDTTNLGACIKNLVDSSSHSINAKRIIKWWLELCEKTVFFFTVNYIECAIVQHCHVIFLLIENWLWQCCSAYQ